MLVLEVELVLVVGPLPALARAREPRRLDQAVVLQEADEDAAQDPGHRHLGEELVAPHLEGLAGAAGLLGLAVLGAELGVELGGDFLLLGRGGRVGGDAGAEVVLELLLEALESLQQDGGVDHPGRVSASAPLPGGLLERFAGALLRGWRPVFDLSIVRSSSERLSVHELLEVVAHADAVLLGPSRCTTA